MMQDHDIWYGTEGSWRQLQELLSVNPSEIKLASGDQDDNPVTSTILNGVGVLSVRGSIVASPNWLTRWFGIPSYPDIKRAVSTLAGNAEVKAIMIEYDSPGGHAKGCKDCANFIRQVSETIKPITSFTNSQATSAAFWLFSAGSTRVVGEDAEVGSIGAIMVHTEFSKMDEAQGVTRTVLRSVPGKARATPYEALTDEAREELQEHLEYTHGQFVDGVSSLLGLSAKKVKTDIATGKVYRASEAVSLKMADAQLSLGETLGKIVKRVNRKPVASKK